MAERILKRLCVFVAIIAAIGLYFEFQSLRVRVERLESYQWLHEIRHESLDRLQNELNK